MLLEEITSIQNHFSFMQFGKRKSEKCLLQNIIIGQGRYPNSQLDVDDPTVHYFAIDSEEFTMSVVKYEYLS